MAEPYEPEPLPEELEELVEVLGRELQRIANSLTATSAIELEELHVAPTRPRNGMVVLADGSDWDPGSGAGFYGYSAGSWTFLG